MKRFSNKAVMLIIFAVTALFYARAVFFPFSAIDDHVYVTANPGIASGISLQSVAWAFTSFYAANWHPLTWLSLMLDAELFGMNPAGFHAVNILLHSANAALLYYLFARLTGAPGRSAFVAACFALHPLHVESVAWITERKDVLSTLLMFLTFLAYLSYIRNGGKHRYALSLALLALGLLAKAMLVTVPILLLLLDFWPLGRLRLESGKSPAAGQGTVLPRVLLEKVPFLALVVASSVLTVMAQRSGAAVATLSQVPFFYRATNALWSTLQYLWKLFFPFDLAVYYPFALISEWKAAAALGLLVAVSVFVFLNRSRRAYLVFGWGWYLVTLLPVVGIVQVGSQAMADRYTYVPYVGLFVMLAWGGAEAAARLRIPERATGTVAAAVLVFLAVTMSLQLDYWKDNVRLLEHTLRITKDNYFTHFALGGYYEEHGKHDAALAEYREVMRINPGAKGIHLFLGRALARQGDPAEALDYLREALRKQPKVADAHFYLGICMERLGRPSESLSAYREAVRLDPYRSRYQTNLGAALAREGRYDEAVKCFSAALELDPKDAKASRYLQMARDLQMQRK